MSKFYKANNVPPPSPILLLLNINPPNNSTLPIFTLLILTLPISTLPTLGTNNNNKEGIYLNKNNLPPLLSALPALNTNSNEEEEIILEIPYFT
ncbi:hypothetical protein OFB58_25180, partial [Escherichia coli]|nr:hypothetical protein [Escherichia coli]